MPSHSLDSRFMRGQQLLLGGLVLLVLSSFDGSQAHAGLASAAKEVFIKHCAKCHANGEKEGSMGYVDDLKQIVAKGKVTPGNLTTSRIYLRMTAGEMPPEGEDPTGKRPTDAEIRAVADWISQGAKPADEGEVVKPEPRTPFLLVDEFRAMRDHLRRLEPEDRLSQRFFSLREFYNTRSRTDLEIDQARAALGKALASVTWRQQPIAIKRLDDSGLVFAINTKEMKWAESNWNALLSYYPYGLKHDQYPRDEAVNRLAEEVYELCGTDLPVLRADWFVARAMRPPLYHTLLGIPPTVGELERRLGVESQTNIRDALVHRAGLTESGISRQHRMIERHAGTHGYYWISYDFKRDGELSDLLRYPLGPVSDDNRFPRQAFKHDGGEIIFRLPNGMQGYMLAKSNGERIDAGPTDIVSDKERISGDVDIVNGLSCLACHGQGTQDAEDVVREGTALGGEALRFLRRIYPTHEDFNKLIEEDRQLFREAALRSMKATAMNPGALAKSDGSIAEPIGPLAKFFAVQPIGLAEISGELGMPEEDLRAILKVDDRFRTLGLGAVANGTGTVKRAIWEDLRNGPTVYQRTAGLLKLGVPKIVLPH